jgi:putative nucleotidyltransferase with HDIG domain
MGIIFGRTKERIRLPNGTEAKMEPEEYRTRIELLYEIAQEASSISEVSKLLERILRVTQQTAGASAASLLLIDEEKEELYFQEVLGEAGAKLRQMRLAPDSGITGWVVRNGTSVLANDVTTDSRFDRNIDETTGFVTKSIIAVPLIRGHKVIGVLEVLNKIGGRTFNERNLRVLEGFASTEALILLVSMASLAINNINNLALDRTLLNGHTSTAEAGSPALETKDPYAYAHAQRVKEYTLLAANCLSLSPQELQTIEFGALFHDIGKIGIHSSILDKPGPLTDSEWHIMREHSRKGANIVGEIPFLEKAKDIVLYHHERYDGKGYPEGLQGNDIPIGARLVAVADAFDTMTTDHSYRTALSVDGAISELIEGIGTQFCPLAVEAFVTAFRKQEGKPAKKETLRADNKKARKAKEAKVTAQTQKAPEEAKVTAQAQKAPEEAKVTKKTRKAPKEAKVTTKTQKAPEEAKVTKKTRKAKKAKVTTKTQKAPEEAKVTTQTRKAKEAKVTTKTQKAPKEAKVTAQAQKAPEEAKATAQTRKAKEAKVTKQTRKAPEEAKVTAQTQKAPKEAKVTQKTQKAKEAKNATQIQRTNHDAVSETYEGDVRLVVPLTVGTKEVRRFKEHLQKVENLKIILTGGSEKEGHIILLNIQKPTALIPAINEMPLVENVDKHGKNIVVTLKNPSD